MLHVYGHMHVLHGYARICSYICQQMINICIYLHIRTYAHIWIYVHTYIYVHTRAYMHIHAYKYIRAIHAYTCIYMHTCIYVYTYTYTYTIHAYMASICTYMHVYCTYIICFHIFWPPRRGRGSLPAEGNWPVQRALKKVSKTMQNSFNVFRSQTPVFRLRGGNLYHYASMAVKVTRLLAVYDPFFQFIRAYMYICAYTCKYIHLRACTYIYIHIRAYTCIYVHIHT